MTGLLLLSFALLAAYWVHARQLQFPLLNLHLFDIRTFRVAATGSFFTRLGIGGVPFLLPLLYQTGLGYSPVQSGLLIVPQAVAAIGMKTILRKLLAGIGYKGVLVSNTLAIGFLLILFTTIHLHSTVVQIVAIACVYGACTSLQYTTMNTLVYADVEEHDASSASSIASTMQQMSISFGVAFAGLTTAFFVPGKAYSDSALMITGIHKALLCLGVLTLASTVVFIGLKRGDGDTVNEHKLMHPDG
jgi:hypothetical protein